MTSPPPPCGRQAEVWEEIGGSGLECHELDWVQQPEAKIQGHKAVSSGHRGEGLGGWKHYFSPP